MDFEFTNHVDFDYKSSLVDEVVYNANTGTMLVFLHNARYPYEYDNVPESIYLGFASADSAGAYYNRHVKGRFNGTQVDLDGVEFKMVAPTVIDAVGTPKGLVASTDTDLHDGLWGNTISSTDNIVLSLSDTDTREAGRKHTVNFLHNGTARTYSLVADSVNEAVNAVNEIADMLDLDFEVQSVVTYLD